MAGFALFRLPYQQHTVLVEQLSGSPEECGDYAELSGKSGFVVAPFSPSRANPILIIRPDRVVVDADTDRLCCSTKDNDNKSSADYHTLFDTFHSKLTNGEFQKLVLSRSITIDRQRNTSPTKLFNDACHRYPRMMIMLVSTPRCGTWLAATPETLLAGCGRQWQTMALAGTQQYKQQICWDDKNIEEQHLVATYIQQQLQALGIVSSEIEPRTIRAGNLAHLRSDFTFGMDDATQIGQVLSALHPTPAVCGLPKQKAYEFILSHEQHDRSYYSGFMGPLLMDTMLPETAGRQATHLFVTLRCMEIKQHCCRLYAGGGLLKDSCEQQEWQETEAKLDTMRMLITEHQKHNHNNV